MIDIMTRGVSLNDQTLQVRGLFDIGATVISYDSIRPFVTIRDNLKPNITLQNRRPLILRIISDPIVTARIERPTLHRKGKKPNATL